MFRNRDLTSVECHHGDKFLEPGMNTSERGGRRRSTTISMFPTTHAICMGRGVRTVGVYAEPPWWRAGALSAMAVILACTCRHEHDFCEYPACRSFARVFMLEPCKCYPCKQALRCWPQAKYVRLADCSFTTGWRDHSSMVGVILLKETLRAKVGCCFCLHGCARLSLLTLPVTIPRIPAYQ